MPLPIIHNSDIMHFYPVPEKCPGRSSRYHV
jgi:hypothetical protein